MLDVLSAPSSVGKTTASARDLAANALVLGVAGAAWFGWAQEGPPAGWATALTVGGVFGVLVAVVAGALTWRRRHGGSAMDDQVSRRAYVRLVGVEAVAIVLGAAALGVSGRSTYAAAWVLLVVGVHFVPLGRLFGIRDLKVVGVLLVVVSAAAVVTGMLGAALPSAVAGAGGGLCMVVFGALSIGRSWQHGGTAGASTADRARAA